jgi:hypothetical protein
MKSNTNPGLHGILAPLDCGFSKVESNGSPEEIIKCGWRELQEETGLEQEDVSGEVIDLGINFNPILRYEIGDQKIPGYVTDLETQLVIMSSAKSKTLIKKIRLSDRHIGNASIKLDAIESLEARRRWSSNEGDYVPTWATGDFYPATRLLKRLTFRNKDGSLVDIVRRDFIHMSDLRQEFVNAITPDEIPKKCKKKWKLGKKIKTILSADDFKSGSAAMAPLSVVKRAALQSGILGPP